MFSVVPALRGVVTTSLPQSIYLKDLILPSRLFVSNEVIVERSEEVQLKFTMSGLLSFLGLPPFVVKMCPPMTTKNYLFHRPLLAVGSANGVVYLLDLKEGTLIKEFSIHTSGVAGIEWCSLESFLSFAVVTSGTISQNFKNELVFVDIETGRDLQL